MTCILPWSILIGLVILVIGIMIGIVISRPGEDYYDQLRPINAPKIPPKPPKYGSNIK